jgi:hypothetical protein
VYMTDDEEEEENVEDIPNTEWVPIHEAEVPENT